MSKNIIIQEGGVNKTLNGIKKIQTAKSGGGDVLWILEEDIKTGDKTIKKNGTYYAKTDGLTGYVKVYVNVPGGKSKTDSDGNLLDDDGDTIDEDGNKTKDSGKDPVKPKPSSGGDNDSEGSNPGVVGKDPDDGNEYHIKTDPTTGDLIRTKIPSSIKVTTPPTKTTYHDGDTLNPSGIIVHKYYGDGTDAGTILESELKYDPMTISGGGGAVSYTTPADDSSLIYKNYGVTFTFIEMPDNVEIEGNLEQRKISLVSHPAKVFAVNYPESSGQYDYVYLVSDQNFTVLYKNEYGERMERSTRTSSPYYYGIQTSKDVNTHIIPLQTQLIGSKTTGLQEDMVYFGEGSGSDKTNITVKWARPTDQKVLTDTFDVTISSGGDIDHDYTGEQQ